MKQIYILFSLFLLLSVTSCGSDDEPKNEHNNNHEAVDLGLSVKWASCNLGAKKPEDAGNYYAFGETSPKSDYSWSTYTICKKEDCRTSSDPIYLEIAGTKFDAAHINWGGTWRTPTKDQFDELMERCTWTKTTKNGVIGYEVKGRNGNTIFLPSVSAYVGNKLFEYDDTDKIEGCYWSSTICTSRSYESTAYFVELGRKIVDWDVWDRCYGLTIRPVCN